MISFFKGVGIILGLFIAGIVVLSISPKIGAVFAGALFIIPLVALFKPIPKLGLNRRGFSAAVAFLVGFPMTLAVVGLNEQSSKLAALAEIDPERQRAELARIADEEAEHLAKSQAAEKVKNAEEEAAAQARLAKEEARKAETAKSENLSEKLFRGIGALT